MAVQSEPVQGMAALIASIPESNRGKVDKEIDFENKNVQGRTIPLHLGRIAAEMTDWEGTIADLLGLTVTDRNDILGRNSQKPELQRYDYNSYDVNFINSKNFIRPCYC